ncbi:MAG: toll/interleukin-1 receptor domain-containing protein [Methylovulum sp.]|nr:toll/interleukin-1 receptor domain-containing protein [Methylovulum sp.]MCF7999028.1 toll/interleukin-1 receptor domain-containing protein [Methylovulum sp.]
MAHDIFISYSHLDSEIRAQLCEELEIAKHSSFWFDQKGIKGGQVWKDKIFEALLESNVDSTPKCNPRYHAASCTVSAKNTAWGVL